MKWSLKNKANLNNIDLVNYNKYILNLSQKPHTPKGGWDEFDTLYIEVSINEIPSTNKIKLELIKLQNEYDISEEVNSFTINGMTGWIDRNTRIALKNSINVIESRGYTTYTIWLKGILMELPITTIRNFLDSLEVYAIEAFNTTLLHLAEIDRIEDRNELFTYDISRGYPEKINISINI